MILYKVDAVDSTTLSLHPQPTLLLGTPSVPEHLMHLRVPDEFLLIFLVMAWNSGIMNAPPCFAELRKVITATIFWQSTQ